jgi:hypothetical protein
VTTNRITYQSQFLFISSGETSDILPVARTQSCDIDSSLDYSFDKQISDGQYESQLSDISINFNTKQFLSNFNFLNLLGIIQSSGTGYFPLFEENNKLNEYRHFYLYNNYDGKDVSNNIYETGCTTYLSENVLNKFNLDISLGNPIFTEFSFDCLNFGAELSASDNILEMSNGNTFTYTLPASSNYDTYITAFTPGSIKISLPESDVSVDFQQMHIQSVRLDSSIARTKEFEIGSQLPTQREVQYPVETSLQISSIIKQNIAENLKNKFNSIELNNFIIDFYDGCSEVKCVSLKCENGKLESFKISSATDGNGSKIDLRWKFTLGPSEIDNKSKISFAFLA